MVDYTIDDAQRRQMVLGRLAATETAHYDASLSHLITTAHPEGTADRAEGLAELNKQIASYEVGIKALREELAKLPAPPAPVTPATPDFAQQDTALTPAAPTP